MKKFISIIIVLSLMVSLIPMTGVFAAEGIVSDEGRLPFKDIKESHWFYESVKFCYANDVVNGMNEYNFGWNGDLTRAQFVTMLANLEGIDTSSYSVTEFTDVKSNHWYYGAVGWAYDNGIVNGMTETTFAPNGVLTRAQLATVMRNYMQDVYTVEVSEDVLDKYTDKPKAEYWYYDAMQYAVSAGLISGVSETTLVSTGTVTRAQAAVIFKSFMQRYFYGNCEHAFSEADCTNASVCSTCGMVQGLPNGHLLKKYHCDRGGDCLVCGMTVAPSKLVHVYKEATCTKGMECRYCGDISGSPLGHRITNGLCYGCSEYVFETPQLRTIYFLKLRGVKREGVYFHALGSSEGNATYNYSVLYDSYEKRIYLFYDYTIKDTYTYINIDITELTKQGYYFECGTVNASIEDVSYGLGYVQPSSGTFAYMSYTGNSDMLKSEFRTLYPKLLKNCERIFSGMIDDASLSDFGFVY